MKDYHGLWPGTVVDTKDPQKQGRLKVRVPQVFGTTTDIADTDLPWAFPCLPFAGKKSGQVMIPEVGAGVWVLFSGGDTRLPVWMGCWLGNEDRVSEHRQGYRPDPQSYAIVTPAGQKIVLTDAGLSTILLEDNVGQYFSLNGSAQTTTLNTQKLTVTAAAAVTLTAATTVAATIVASLTVTCPQIVLGIGAAQFLCNLAFLLLFNNHTHKYNPGPGSATETQPPSNTASQGVHTTANTRAS